jgi:hypothetical protein
LEFRGKKKREHQPAKIDELETNKMKNIRDVRQTEMHTAEPLVPGSRAFEVQMTTDKLKRHKSPGTDQIPAELIKAG